MRKHLLRFFLLLLCCGWTSRSLAYWEKSDEPITTPTDLKPGMFICLVNVNSEMAATKMLSTPGFSYLAYDNVMPKHVFELFDAGKNEWTDEQMYYLRSVETGKFLGSSNEWDASEEDAIPITFAHGNVWCGVPGWGTKFPGPDDEVTFPADKVPQWDWRNGDCLLFFHYLSEFQVQMLGHVWGWDNYKTCSFGPLTLTPGNRITSTAPWYAYEATYVDSPLNDLSELVTELTTANYTGTRYIAGTTFGCVDSLVVKAYEDALAAANELLIDVNSTDEQLRAAYNGLLKAKENLLGGVILPEDGHYYYIYLTDPRFEQIQGQKRGWYMDKTAVRWGPLDTDDIRFLFKLEKQADGSFAIRSVMDGRYLSGATTVSDTPTTTQSFFPSGYGNFYIINGIKPSTGGNDVYHADGHGDGKGVSGPLKIWGQKGGLGTSDWNFMELTDLSRIDEMRKVYEQKLITENFNAQLAQARADSAAGYWTKHYITSVSQLSTNAQQTSEGPIANLIDGKYDTYFHTSWSTYIGQPHYLQIELKEPLQKFALYYKKRHNNNNNRPTQMTILASNDGETFNEVYVLPVAPDTLPTSADVIEYRSEKAIDLGSAYKYIRFRVDSTNNGALEPASSEDPEAPRYPFFTFSEFNLSDEGFPLDTESMGFREDMIKPFADLKAAIDAALAKDPTTVTQADVDELIAANAAFAAAYPDTTGLSNAIKKAQGYVETVFVAQDPSNAKMGMCTDQAAVDKLKAAADAARAALDANPKMTRAALDAQTATLVDEQNTFFKSIVMPDMNKWYFIENKSTAVTYPALNSIVYPSSNSVGAGLKWGGSVEENGLMSPTYLWKFIPTGAEDGSVYVQNIGTGFYLGEFRGTSAQFLLSDTAVSYNIVYVAGGELTLQQNKAGTLPIHAASNNNVVAWSASAHNGSVWTFVEANDEQVSEIEVSDNWADVICLPYDVTGEFFAYNDDGDASPVAYEITGARFDGEGNVTEIGLSEMKINDGVIPAGTPFILMIGDPANEEKTPMKLDLGLIFDSEITTTVKDAGAMVGVLTSTPISKGMGYFSNTGLVPNEKDGLPIIGQTGYIDATKLKGAQEVGEIFIPVNGGSLTNIKQAIKNASTLVTVYTADGQVVRKDVKASEALKGLKKGMYILNNGNKVSVK